LNTFRRWLFWLGFCALIVLVSIVHFDRAIADYAHQFGAARAFLRNDVLRLPVLQAVGVCLLLWGALFSRAGAKTAFSAGLAMTGAMALNICLLKPAFGRAVPWLYFARHNYGFHPFQVSSLLGSFPSGHAVLAGALASVLWVSCPKGRPSYLATSALLASLLVLGEWHFLSDLVAGTFVGISAGLAAMALTDAAVAGDGRLRPALHFLDEDVMGLMKWPSRRRREGIAAKSPEFPAASRQNVSQEA
jgi:membrane-associated phospholipid phosphatase